ncbi:hypothetical protein [Mycolicibacterium sp.]|uniref:hypothetical protein n=1 Tax=Mycolicibacterium sp. TaxID=2320850 RepID=UPI0037C62BC4
MATHTVLPLSAVKSHVTTLFDSLKDDSTVYVSKHGRIVAAFWPLAFVPETVRSAYSSPHADLPTLTATEIGRNGPSDAISKAERGLPTVVGRDGRIYGILTRATAPQPATVPDPAIVGAKSDALLDFQRNNPDATIEDIMAFSDDLDADQQHAGRFELDLVPANIVSDAAVAADIGKWISGGSEVEDVVQMAFRLLKVTITMATTHDGVKETTMDLTTLKRAELEPGPTLIVKGDYYITPRARVLSGEKLVAEAKKAAARGQEREAARNLTAARAVFIDALTDRPLPDPGVMWHLGSLALEVGHTAEAAQWFNYSLGWDVVCNYYTFPEDLPERRERAARPRRRRSRRR